MQPWASWVAAAGALLAACSSSSGAGSTAEPDASVMDSGPGFEGLDASVPTEGGETPESGGPSHPDATSPFNSTGSDVTPQAGAVVNPALGSSCVSQGPLR